VVDREHARGESLNNQSSLRSFARGAGDSILGPVLPQLSFPPALAIAFVAHDSFNFFLSIKFLIGLVVGGVGSLVGSVVGGIS
jgi:hypothetical protein